MKLLRRNVISNAVGITVPAVAWAIVVPVLVHRLGEQGYGVYTIAISFAGVLGLLELGLTSAATKYIAQVDIRGNPDMLEGIISSNLSLYVVLGSVVALSCFVFAPHLASLLFRASDINQNDVTLVVRLVGVILALTLLRNALSSVLMGFHRYDVYNAIQVSYAVVLALVQAAIVIRGGQVVALMLGNVAVMAASLMGLILAIHHVAPGVCLVRPPDPSLIRVLFSFGMYMMLINLTATVVFNVDKLIIGWLVGPESVTYYAVPAQIALKIHTGLAVFIAFIFPLASEAQSVGDEATLRKLYLHGMRFVMLADGLAMVFLGTFAREILAAWIGPEFAKQSAPILVLMSVGYLAYALSITPFHILMGMGYPRALAVLNALTALCVIVCLYVGVTCLGLMGGCIGVAVGMGTTVLLPWYVQRTLDVPWTAAFGDSYGRTIVCSACGIAIGAVLPAHFLVRVIFYVSFSAALLLFGNTRREDWRPIHHTWKQAIARISESRSKC